MNRSLVLASSSPRRRQLLMQAGIAFNVVAVEIDETPRSGEAPVDYVVRMALEKARSGRRAAAAAFAVLGADTAVVVDDVILGKPGSAGQARAMLRQLADRSHAVYSAVALLITDGRELAACNCSHVTFAPLDNAWIDAYCATGEPLDKAGAYAIQGRAAQRICRLDGSYSAVMGLPLYETVALLEEAGLAGFPHTSA